MRFNKLIGTILVIVVGIIYASDNTLQNGWMPNWKVGDWWIIKTRYVSWISAGPPLPESLDMNTVQPFEIYYKVIGMEKINGHNCFAVEQRRLPIDESFPEKRIIYYFRKDNLQIIRSAEYSYAGREIEEPILLDYVYSYKVPFISSNWDLNVFPSFPLVYEGEEAKSLAVKRFDPQNRLVTQTVTVRRVEEFNEMTKAVDKIYTSQGDCYYVLIEQWHPDSTNLKILDFKEIWIPSLPWLLYSESSRPENGKLIPLLKSWLADYSGWHKKK
ncbi:MAG: hypothetical protein ACETVX_05905 [bacterium]